MKTSFNHSFSLLCAAYSVLHGQHFVSLLFPVCECRHNCKRYGCVLRRVGIRYPYPKQILLFLRKIFIKGKHYTVNSEDVYSMSVASVQISKFAAALAHGPLHSSVWTKQEINTICCFYFLLFYNPHYLVGLHLFPAIFFSGSSLCHFHLHPWSTTIGMESRYSCI